MQRSTPLDTSLRAYSSGGSRGVVHEVGAPSEETDPNDRTKAKDVKDGDFLQELKIDMMADETRERVEHPQNYGFSSHVLKADKGQNEGTGEEEIKTSAEHFVQFMGGNRTFPVVQNLDDRRVRLRCLEEGETVVYDDQQQKVHIQRHRIFSRSQFKIEQRVIVDQPRNDGHGRDKVASRDQTKDKSLRLSTIMMDPETILLERTKPKSPPQQQESKRDPEEKWQEGGEKGPDNPEKELQKCSQVHMAEKRIALTTYREGEAHLMIELDEDSGLISFLTLDSGRPRLEFSLDSDAGSAGLTNHETPGGPGEAPKPGLVFEVDDKNRKILLMTTRDEQAQLVVELDAPNDRITIKTNGKTEQVFDNASSTITIHADTVVKIGDRSADIPVAIMNSVDSMGHRIVGGCATKVLAK